MRILKRISGYAREIEVWAGLAFVVCIMGQDPALPVVFDKSCESVNQQSGSDELNFGKFLRAAKTDADCFGIVSFDMGTDNIDWPADFKCPIFADEKMISDIFPSNPLVPSSDALDVLIAVSAGTMNNNFTDVIQFSFLHASVPSLA